MAAGVVWVVQWGEDVAGMAYGVDVCVCGVVRTCVGRCACEVCEMQRCGEEADDMCDWGVGYVCWGVRATVGMVCEVGACVSGVVW